MQSTNVYWLVLDPAENHHNKRLALEERGFSVAWFKTLGALLDKVMSERAGFYIVGDEGAEANVLKAITTLSSHPDLAGAKLVLSSSNHSPSILRAVACEGFRDILPMGIPDKEWAQRFLFSTATRPIPLPAPSSLVWQDSPGQLSLPARLVTINTEMLFLESRLSPLAGDPIELTGPLAQALGQPALHLKVEDRKPPHLRYRFSEGFYAAWQTKSVFDSPAGREVQQMMQSFGASPRPRVFFAIQSPALRAALMRHLDQRFYDIHSALQKRSIVEDPKFFAPHLVFIEERMCVQENLSRFAAMVPQLPLDSTIVVLGDEEHKSALQGVSGGLRIVFLRQVPMNLRDVVEKSYLPASARKVSIAGAYAIPCDHEFSMGELVVPCRVTASHPTMVRLAVPRQVGPYALAALCVPWLRKMFARDPYVKIVQTFTAEENKGSEAELTADCYFCDVTADLRKKLARGAPRGEGDELLAQAAAGTTSAREVPAPLSAQAGAEMAAVPVAKLGQEVDAFAAPSFAGQQSEAACVSVPAEAASHEEAAAPEAIGGAEEFSPLSVMEEGAGERIETSSGFAPGNTEEPAARALPKDFEELSVKAQATFAGGEAAPFAAPDLAGSLVDEALAGLHVNSPDEIRQEAQIILNPVLLGEAAMPSVVVSNASLKKPFAAHGEAMANDPVPGKSASADAREAAEARAKASNFSPQRWIIIMVVLTIAATVFWLSLFSES